jgi:hypothetical protein
MMSLKGAPDFFVRERMRSGTKVADEYCWAITQRSGGHAAADQIPVCWSL